MPTGPPRFESRSVRATAPAEKSLSTRRRRRAGQPPRALPAPAPHVPPTGLTGPAGPGAPGRPGAQWPAMGNPPGAPTEPASCRGWAKCCRSHRRRRRGPRCPAPGCPPRSRHVTSPRGPAPSEKCVSLRPSPAPPAPPIKAPKNRCDSGTSSLSADRHWGRARKAIGTIRSTPTPPQPPENGLAGRQPPSAPHRWA